MGAICLSSPTTTTRESGSELAEGDDRMSNVELGRLVNQT